MGRGVKTGTTKEVRKTYNIKSGEVKSKTKIKIAKGSRATYEMAVKSPHLSLSRFIKSVRMRPVRVKKRKGGSYRAKRQFVTVEVRRGGRKVVDGGFFAKKQIFKRENEHRDSIQKMVTLSVPQMFHDGITFEALKEAERKYKKTLKHHLLFYISK
jgi:hypothetical protein